MIVRSAEYSDADEVIGLARKFHSHTNYKHIDFDYDTAKGLFQAAVDQGMCFVADNGQLVGFVLGLGFPSLLNKNVLMGSELAWWVEPEYRGSPAAIRLLKNIEAAAKEKGIQAWSMICLESMNPEIVQDIYLRMGYHKSERTFTKFF